MKRYEDSYIFWMVLKDECDKVVLTDDDYLNATQIKNICCKFDLMSKSFLKNLKPEEFYDIWCETKNLNKGYKELFEEFSGYLWYASDRMNINRWLYCRLNITNAVNSFYNELVKTETESKKWFELTNEIEINAKNWFESEFETLYKAKEDSENE
jgi:hypothetical protein